MPSKSEWEQELEGVIGDIWAEALEARTREEKDAVIDALLDALSAVRQAIEDVREEDEDEE